jgi:glycosyltransferase involved in cell wall biosynthesis
VLVGGGPEEQHLRSLAPPGVRFAPAGDRTRVVRWLLAADVLAFPSRWETLSLAVLEALELGRAVVVSDCSGMREALADGPGTMVPGEDPHALAVAVARFAGDRDLAAATGAAAAEHYRQTHARARATLFAEYQALLVELSARR